MAGGGSVAVSDRDMRGDVLADLDGRDDRETDTECVGEDEIDVLRLALGESEVDADAEGEPEGDKLMRGDLDGVVD